MAYIDFLPPAKASRSSVAGHFEGYLFLSLPTLLIRYPCSDHPDEFIVRTKEGDFSISHYPLEQSKFLFDMMEAKKNFGNEINKYFDYTMFSYRLGF